MCLKWVHQIGFFLSFQFRYVVLTSKHHDGYALWPSTYSYSWNSVDIGPHRDIITELSTAIRTNTSLKFGLYHSLYEWFNPMYLSDKQQSFSENLFVVNKVSITNIHSIFWRIYEYQWIAPSTVIHLFSTNAIYSADSSVPMKFKSIFFIKVYELIMTGSIFAGNARNVGAHKHF